MRVAVRRGLVGLLDLLSLSLSVFDPAADVDEALGVFSGVRAVRRAHGPVAGAQVL